MEEVKRLGALAFVYGLLAGGALANLLGDFLSLVTAGSPSVRSVAVATGSRAGDDTDRRGTGGPRSMSSWPSAH